MFEVFLVNIFTFKVFFTEIAVSNITEINQAPRSETSRMSLRCIHRFPKRVSSQKHVLTSTCSLIL